MNKLNLDKAMVEEARLAARHIAESIQTMVNQHTTVSVERTVARLMGIDGVNELEIPLPNIVVDKLQQAGRLAQGIAYWLGNAMLFYQLTPQEIADGIVTAGLDILDVPQYHPAKVREVINPLVEASLQRIQKNRSLRAELMTSSPPGPQPYLYVIVATGNIYEDVIQARSAAQQGADIIAVIRSTGQSLLDYVPYGPTTEGFGGTYATQANFKIMRQALDEIGQQLGRYIQLVNYCSGLCMPEIAAMGALERLDMMLNDAMYGILFRDINMQRTFIDQYFSRLINAYAGVVINTGEDNYLTTADAYQEGHTVLASQFINEQLAFLSGLQSEQMGLGHAFEMNPSLEDGLLYEIAQAQLSREIFPKAPLKYMPPTKHMTGNIFQGHIQDGLFNLVSVLTQQGIHLTGMLTEAIHTPFMQDRALSLANARYVMHNARHLGDEIEFKQNGIIQQRAHQVLAKAHAMLLEVERLGLPTALAKGMFADIKRTETGGKGLAGVIKRSEDYYNPFMDAMRKELAYAERDKLKCK